MQSAATSAISQSPVPPSGFFRTLCWAIYLGCSWTWCIGMFLPVILVSEFGLKAWFVFAIPNVVGAAAMGWTLARPGSSEKMLADHRSAAVSFSAITLAFHVFFLYWLTFTGIMPKEFSTAAVGLGIVLSFVGRRKIGFDFILAFAVLCLSLVVLGIGLAHPIFGVSNPVEASRANISMVGLAPVCLLGFLLCPYLDVTFHRARQETAQASGRFAFGIGFGVVFLSMIVLTLLYTADFALDSSAGDQVKTFGRALLITWVAGHIAAQAGFTFAAHLRALPTFRRIDLLIWGIAIGLAIAAIIGVRKAVWIDIRGPIQMLTAHFIYRLFMSFYGLVFPAYVWICMVPIGRVKPAASKRTLTIFAIANLIAIPFYWFGFIQEQMLWLLPGVALVLLAKCFAMQSRHVGLDQN